MKTLLYITFVYFALTSYVDAKTNVYYAGFAFASDYINIDSEFPYTKSILELKDENNIPLLEKELNRKIYQSNFSNLNLITDSLGDYRSGEAISLAFALSWENISTERAGEWTKLVVDIHAQILFFDYSDMRVINTYPLRVQVRDAVEGEPSSDYLIEIISRIYFKEGSSNIFCKFVEGLNSISVKKFYSNYLQVKSVVFEEKASSLMDENSVNAISFASFLGNTLSSFLALNQGVAILPYSKGEVIGNKMAARFANGDIYHLEIPQPDYVIDLTVRGFKKVHINATNTQSVWAYGSFVRIFIKQPDSEILYLDAPFKFALRKNVPVSVEAVDDWTAFQESLLSLLNQFTLQISEQDANWLDKWSDGLSVKKQMNQVNRIVEMCK